MKQQQYDYEFNEEGEVRGGGARSLPGMAAAERATFLTKTYSHLLLAIVAFVAFEVALFQMGVAQKIATAMVSVSWLFILGGFMLAGFLANRFALQAKSLTVQYLGLAIYIVAMGFICIPLLVVANLHAPGVIENSALITLVGFSALSVIVFITRADFSWMRSLLMWGSFAALGFIVVGYFMGWNGGVMFPALMIALMGGWILYDTSNVLHHYPEDRYVGAALALFSSIAMMFYYVVILFLNRD